MAKNILLKRIPEKDSQKVLECIEEGLEGLSSKYLSIRIWSNELGVGYCVRDNTDHTRVAAFLVSNFTSNIKVWLGFEADFDEISWIPTIGVENVSQFEATYAYQNRKKAAEAILGWIVNSVLVGFVANKPEPVPFKEIEIPVISQEEATEEAFQGPIETTYSAPEPERNWAQGPRRKRNNMILHVLELAEQGVVAYDVIHAWFFNGRSAEETARRLKRVARYGYKLHSKRFTNDKFEGFAKNGWQLFFMKDDKKIDLKLVLADEHAARIERAWKTVDDAFHNEFVIVLEEFNQTYIREKYLKLFGGSVKEAEIVDFENASKIRKWEILYLQANADHHGIKIQILPTK